MDTIIARTIPQYTSRMLGQARPGDTNPAKIYSPADGVVAEITSIVVSNTTVNTPSFRIFHDNDGETYDQTTALYYDQPMVANTTQVLDPKIAVCNCNGSIGVRSSAISEITFTVYGRETQARAG